MQDLGRPNKYIKTKYLFFKIIIKTIVNITTNECECQNKIRTAKYYMGVTYF